MQEKEQSKTMPVAANFRETPDKLMSYLQNHAKIIIGVNYGMPGLPTRAGKAFEAAVV
jgi:hypothetical protein